MHFQLWGTRSLSLIKGKTEEPAVFIQHNFLFRFLMQPCIEKRMGVTGFLIPFHYCNREIKYTNPFETENTELDKKKF